MFVSPVLCLLYCQRSVLCVCKSCVVFAQCTASTVCRAGATTSPHIIILFCFFCTTASAVCCVCKSCVVFALLTVQCTVCVGPVLCLLNVLPA